MRSTESTTADAESQSNGPDFPSMPTGWEWRSGSQGSGHYTRWFGTTFRMGGSLVGCADSLGGFDGELYWDEGGNGKHHVQIRPITGVDSKYDDPIFGYPAISRSFDSEQEALDAIPKMLEELKEK